jgi:hypothetical protein
MNRNQKKSLKKLADQVGMSAGEKVVRGYLLCASERVYKKPKIKDGISVPPMRGIMEMKIFIQAD